VETGWILEANEPMNRAVEALAGHVVKRYRIYRKPLRPRRRGDPPAAPRFPGSPLWGSDIRPAAFNSPAFRSIRPRISLSIPRAAGPHGSVQTRRS
jgi:hypothetical protein